MLKDYGPEMTLAYPDYEQTAEDHGRISLLVRSLGSRTDVSISEKGILKDEYAVKEDVVVKVRWIEGKYPLENNQWGDFQVHRAVLGILSYGVAETLSELTELLNLHDSTKVKYGDTLIDSRLVVIGWAKDPTGSPPPISNGHTRIIYYDAELDERIQEFINSIFLVLDFKRHNLSIEKQDRLPLFSAPFEKKDFVGLDMESRVNKRRIYGRCQKYIGDLSLLCGSISEAYGYYETAADVLRSCHDWLWLANACEGLCVTSTIGAKRKIDRKILSPFEIIDKYREINGHYSKYKHAGIIETECSIKAVHALKEVKNFLLAADFLQNIVFINLQMNDAEKIKRFSALSKLYSDIGFKRKAAFFNRVAAMRCVAPQNPNPQWSLCYQLLCKTVTGYQLSKIVESSLRRTPGLTSGWPSLQIQILSELLGTSRRMGNIRASITHVVSLLDGFFMELTPKERVDFCHQLGILTENYYEAVNGCSQSSSLSKISIYRVPLVESFYVKPPSSNQVPVKIRKIDETDGPFLFTPIVSASNSSSFNKRNRRIQWIQFETAEVELMICNPLGVEVKVMDLRLEFQGIDFETFGSTFSMAPFSGPHTVTLIGKPLGIGELKIRGYSCSTFGLRSICLLSELSSGNCVFGEEEDEESGGTAVFIDVIPSLPQLNITLDSSSFASFLYWGESLEVFANFKNVGTKPVDEISFSNLTLSTISETPSNFVVFNENNNSIFLNKINLPLAPGESVSRMFVLLFRGGNDILLNNNRSSGKSLNQSSFYELCLTLTTSYSSTGDEFRRQSVEKVTFQLRPSATAIDADVLEGDDDPKKCCLVLDVKNLTSCEMDLALDENKTLILEPRNICRVPLYVPKLSRPSTERGVLDYLSSSTSLKWTLPETSRSGWVSLCDLQFTPKMIKSLCQSPISVELTRASLEDIKVFVVESSTINCHIGNKVDLKLTVKKEDDKREVLIQSLDLKYDRSLSKSDGFILSKPKALWNSVLKESSAYLEHSFFILPVVPGNYDLHVSCEFKIVRVNEDDAKCDTYFKTISLNVQI